MTLIIAAGPWGGIDYRVIIRMQDWAHKHNAGMPKGDHCAKQPGLIWANRDTKHADSSICQERESVCGCVSVC